MKKFTFILVLFSYVSFAQQFTYIDFGITTNTTPGNWNNVAVANAASASGISLGLIDATGASTGVTLTIDDAFNTVNTAGNPTPNASLPFPSTAAADSFFGSVVTFQGALEPTGGFILTGLDPSKYYSFSIFASRDNVTDVREALYTITGTTIQTATLNASNNTSNTADIFDVQPNVAGQIIFMAQPSTNNTNSSGFYYLGAIEITRRDAPLSVAELEFVNSVSISPNPVNDICNFSFNLTQGAKVKIDVYDITGKLVTNVLNENHEAGQFSHAWDRTNENAKTLKSGIYIVNIQANGNIYTAKLLLK